MKCPKCKSMNVTVSMEEVGSKTKKTSVGLGGHINNFLRTLLAICTLGISNLIWKKAKGEAKTKTIMKKICVCQDCGYSWETK